MVNNKNKLDALVDLDAIMDTRLPLLYYLDEELASEMCIGNKYYKRVNDSFGYITSNIFTNLYKSRNKSLLTLATPTYILTLLKEYYLEVSGNDKVLGGDGEVTIYLNIYPYELNVSEIELLEAGLIAAIGDVKVKVISIKYTDITPKWIDEHINIMILYNGLQWVEHHTSTLDLIKTPLIQTTLLVPRLILGNLKSIKNVSNMDTIFKDMENNIRSLISLKMLPVRDFCSLN